jgi:hypothetical protein
MAFMVEHFDYWPEAEAAIRQLEANAELAPVLEAVNRTLARLAADPYDRRLATTAFMTPELGGISATPVRVDDWYIFWQRGAEADVLDIVLIAQLDLGARP